MLTVVAQRYFLSTWARFAAVATKFQFISPRMKQPIATLDVRSLIIFVRKPINDILISFCIRLQHLFTPSKNPYTLFQCFRENNVKKNVGVNNQKDLIFSNRITSISFENFLVKYEPNRRLTYVYL